MKQTIQVIQGDTLDLKVSVSSIDNIELIDKIFFSSRELGITKELIKVEEENETYWLLMIKDTSDLPSCYATFDITVKLINESKQTVVYNADINVLPKGNTINEH